MYADYTDRYGHAHRLNRTSLVASTLIVGGMVASIMLVAPRMVVLPKPPTINIYQIPITPPPPDPLPKTQPQPHAKQISIEHPTAPVPKVPLPTPADPVTTDWDLHPLPPIPLGPSGGDGTGTKPLPTPSPVFVDASADPRYAADFQPPYPPSEERAGNNGEVRLRVLIGTDGRVKSLEALSQTSDAFLAVTRRQALARWRFKPATRGGVPVETTKVITVHFVLND